LSRIFATGFSTNRPLPFFEKKFIRVADDLLFDGYRDHLTLGQRQVMAPDIFATDPHADVPLADECQFRYPFSFNSSLHRMP
jgi:hypothetical protein